MKILGIQRSAKFSPNMVERDLAILLDVKEELEAKGYEVDIMSEDNLHEIDYDLSGYDKVYGMERDIDNLEKLMEKNGDSKFINPLQGILDTTNRYDLLRTFIRKEVSMPACSLNDKTGVASNGEVSFPMWIKRGDGCAQQKEDTSYVTTQEEADKVIADFKERNVERYVVQQHLAGDLIKFYGVEGTDFFDWNYAYGKFSKFGLEEINGKEHGYRFEESQLRDLVNYAARASKMPVYGGDAIVDENGKIYIIDFNDWPSFSRCRKEAAKAIAERMMKE